MRRANGLVGVGAAGLVRVLGLAWGTMLVAAPAALASPDVKPQAARVVIVAKDGTALRCDAGNVYYAVRMLSAGEALRVDGETNGWLRVEYPAGTRAYVRADEATFDAAAKSVTLAKASNLMAANAGGVRPWAPLLDKAIAAGTVLTPAEEVKATDGSVEGYLVPAPAAARGYVRNEQVRTPVGDEGAKLGVTTPTPTVTTAKPAAPTAEPAEEAPEIIEVRPASPDASGFTEPRSPSITPTSPRNTPRLPGESSARKVTITSRIDDVNLLRDMFERALKPGSDEAELTTVISEFNRTMDSLGTSGDEGRIRTALEQRMKALTMRQQIIEAKRQLNDSEGLDERLRDIRLAVEHAQKQALYATVGRMLPSTVYDGKRGMPLMYRVESADFSSTRTIGYVVPREGMDMLVHMGKIVGIVGDTRMDPALGLNIIAPSRIDELRVQGGRFEVVPGATIEPAPMRRSEPSMSPETPVKSGQPAAPTVKPTPMATPEPIKDDDINK